MRQQTRDAIAQEIADTIGMDAAVADLSEYAKNVTLISFDKLDIHSPRMLRILANFADEMAEEMCEEIRISMSGISRRATREEMERSAIENYYWKDRERWEAIENA